MLILYIPYFLRRNKSLNFIVPVNKENIYKEYNFSSLHESFNNAKDFIDKSLNGILINDKNKFNFSSNPLVSVVIPVFNIGKYINNAIKSIQNQELFNLEIILVNDYSSDNSLNIIEQLQIEDPRIQIINNKKNMGILYSRSIGALSSKGKYIFPLDNDDMLLDKDVLTTITNIAKEGNFDIVEFKAIQTWRRSLNQIFNNRIETANFANHTLNLVLYQPELSTFPIQPGDSIDKYNLISCYLWAKCIKTTIYKKALNSIGEEKYSRFMIAWEDKITMVFLFNTANSYKFVGKYGILHLKTFYSGYWKTKQIDMNLVDLYLADISLDFVKDTDGYKKLIPNLVYAALNIKSLEEIIKMDDKYKKILFSCLDRFLKLSFISSDYKNIIINKTKSLTFLDYNYYN